jgi:hypothetical protein
LRAGPEDDAEVMTELESGEDFEVIELAGDHAWGRAVRRSLVGYVDADALGAAG